MATTIRKRIFGETPEGATVHEFEFLDENGASLRALNYGGIVTAIYVPDKNGNLTDVVLGFDSLAPYLVKHPFFGAMVGRVAGRVPGGLFVIDGQEYRMVLNAQERNHLHGGFCGFDKKIWDAEIIAHETGEALRLSYTSPDGEEGYPGTLCVTLIYSFAGGIWSMETEVTTDKPTPVALTNHSYFNLTGKGDILGHEAQVFSDFYFPAADEYRTLGSDFAPVEGTPADWRKPRTVAAAIRDGIYQGHGDIYFLGAAPQMRDVVSVREPSSGRTLRVETDEPCVQFYLGSNMQGTVSGKVWQPYNQYSGLCVECQGYPAAAGRPDLGDIILRPGEIRRHETRYIFGNFCPLYRETSTFLPPNGERWANFSQ